jgi:hypothetical protein
MDQYLIYIGQLLALTLGVMVVCGLVAWMARKIFMYFVGDKATFVLYASSIVGTPVHELGHALMCIPFAHRITDMKLLLPPSRRSRTLGYVEHSYNRKNPWAVFGDLFISFGPIFSGIGVMVLVLTLCFPAQWEAYLNSSRAIIEGGVDAQQIAASASSLLFSLFEGLKGDDAVRSIVGLLIILSVSQHITLSLADLKGCFRALLMYTGIVAIFAGVTMLLGMQNNVLSGLMQINLPLLSLFCVSIAFSLVWVIIALLVYLLRWLKVLF